MLRLPKGWISGEGPLDAPLMLIGEAAGANEAKQGRPFVGASGTLLRNSLEEVGFDVANDFYITNVVKWRPLNNMTPTMEMIEEGLPYLQEEIEEIQPKFILAVGNVPFRTLADTEMNISLYRGSANLKLSKKFGDGIGLYATFHPAYILYNRKRKEIWMKDLRQFRELTLDS